MGDAAGELANRIQLLRLKQRLASVLQRLARLPLHRDVARYLRESNQPAIIRMHCIDHDVGPEYAAILTKPLPLFFIAAIRPSRGECTHWFTGCLILGCIKTRKMRADDFRWREALDALCARVPTRDLTRRRQHENGVVGDALHQKPKLLLA